MDGAAGYLQLITLGAYLEACRRLRTWRQTEDVLALLAGIADPELRLHRFGEHLRDRSPQEAAWAIAWLHERLTSGDLKAQRICLGLLDLGRLTWLLGREAIEAIRAVLEREADPSAGLFVDERARTGENDDETVPRPKEPVGYRIAMARRPIPALIERLLFDSDARVVRTILTNPRLTEAEVLKLAASRRVAPEILGAVAQCDRWITRYPVKLALANNPVTPTRVVLGLLPYLMRQDLQWLATGARRDEVREQAASLLQQRQPS